MRKKPKDTLLIAFLSFALAWWGQPAVAQEMGSSARLLQDMHSPDRGEQAREQLRHLATLHPQVRVYLATQLPSIIEAGAQPQSSQWRNSIELAGDLKMAEAASALAKWLGVNTGRGSKTLGEEMRLELCAPAMALSKIGEPALPSIQKVLSDGNLRERWRAVLVIRKIGSIQGRAALREHATVETDKELRDFINRALLE